MNSPNLPSFLSTRRRLVSVLGASALCVVTLAGVHTAGPKFFSDDPITRELDTEDASGAEEWDIDLFYDLTYNLNDPIAGPYWQSLEGKKDKELDAILSVPRRRINAFLRNPIVRRIIVEHGGTIEASATPFATASARRTRSSRSKRFIPSRIATSDR